MRQTILILLTLLLAAADGRAQGTVTPAVTVFREFKPATIYLSNGKKLKVGLANIFLKNSSLIYKSGEQTKEANLNTLQKVEFKDRTYYRIDSLLAYMVDTVGNDALFCAEKIDFVSWRQQVANNSLFTSLDLSNSLSYTTAELANEQDLHFPISTLFYYRLNNQYVLVHERNLKRLLSKEKRRLMASVMAEKEFSWTDSQSLIKLLTMIQEK